MTNITNSAGKRTANKITNKQLPVTGIGYAKTLKTGLNIFGNVTAAVSQFVTTLNPVSLLPFQSQAEKDAFKWAVTDSALGQGSSVTNQSSNSKYKKFGLQTPGSGGAGGSGGAAPKANPGTIPIQSDPDQSYSWNLPPHEWSLPVDPSEINGDISSPTVDSHSLRRGKIFLARKYVGPTATNDPKTSAQTFDRKGTQNYGFQFSQEHLVQLLENF